MKVLKVCPRCGGQYSYIERRRVGERVYLYAVHREGRKVVRKCYLGPLGGYVAVESVHKLGALTNVRDQVYLEIAISALEKELEVVRVATSIGAPIDVEQKLSQIETARRLLDEIASTLAEVLGSGQATQYT